MTDAITEPALRAAIEQAADPVQARLFLTQLIEQQPALSDELAFDGRRRTALVAVASASRSLTRALLAEPALRMVLHDLDDARTLAELQSLGARAIAAADDPADALRRWKRGEVLRIAARDLLGLADLRAVGRELADLATACLAAAVTIAAPTIPVAIIGMGKLGGRELN